MTVPDEGQYEQRSRLHAQVELILSGIPGVVDGLEGAAAHPADWADRGEVDYHHRDRTLLVRDADVERVTAVVPGTPVAHDNNVRGLTRLEFSADERRSVEEACAHIDRTLGEGVATPDHVLYVCTSTTCPATEPEEVPADAKPDPEVSAERDDGEGVLMVVLDSGLLPGAADAHSWLHGVDGRDWRTRSAATRLAFFPMRATGRSWPASRGPWRPRLRCGWTRRSPSSARSSSLTWSSRYLTRSRWARRSSRCRSAPTAGMTSRCWASRSWKSGCDAMPDRSWWRRRGTTTSQAPVLAGGLSLGGWRWFP